MRFLLVILTTVIFSTVARAEYNGYHIQFKLETANGEASIGFVYVASAYLNSDSLKSTNYLKKALDQSWKEWNKRDSLVYFKERIKYEYRQVGYSMGEKTPIYALDSRHAISIQEVKSIEIVEMIDYTYIIGISSSISISDTTWTKQEPVRSYSFGGYLCYHQVFIHESSERIENIIERLQTKQDLLNESDDDDDDDKIDNDFWEIIEELFGEKVVVITECTC